jgi:hypothetical protein
LLSAAGSPDSKLASALVEHAWRHHAVSLNGRRGRRPRHEVVAVFALALAVNRGAFGEGAKPRIRSALDGAIGRRGLYRERSRQWVEPLDRELLDFARAVNDKPGETRDEPARRL